MKIDCGWDGLGEGNTIILVKKILERAVLAKLKAMTKGYSLIEVGRYWDLKEGYSEKFFGVRRRSVSWEVETWDSQPCPSR